MKYACYILYSPSLDKYYIGETENIEERIQMHNTGFFKNAYTSKVSDWELYLMIPCRDRIHARKVEKYIKNMKSRKYIENLKNKPDFLKRLEEKYP